MSYTIGFYNPASVQPYATEAAIASVRLIYPDAPIAMSCDAGVDFSKLCDQYKVKYFHYYHKIGYPSGAGGYSKEQILTWLDRAYVAATELGTDYFVMWEDDCVLVRPITIDPEWVMAGQCFMSQDQNSPIPDPMLDIVENFCGVRPKKGLYNCGGGSIFHTKTFITNYHKIRQFWHVNFNDIQQRIYISVGWIDCFLTLFFYMTGAKMVENRRLYNNWPLEKPFNFTKLGADIEIVHYVKDLYQ